MRGFVFVLALVAVTAAQSAVDSYHQAALDAQASLDHGSPDHGLAPPPADHVSPVARHILISAPQPQQDELPELTREKRQYGYGGGYGRRGYGRRYGGYGGYGGGRYPGGYGGYGGYPGGGYGGGYGGYPGGYGGGYPGYGGGYGGYPGGGGFGGSNSQANAQSSSFSLGGGFGPFQGSISSSNANAGSSSYGFGR